MLVKMFIKIDPLSMRGSLVMTMASISPSWREVSPAEQLRRSPRFVLPNFCLETAVLRPESFLLIFFLGQNTPYRRMWASGACQVAHKAGGAPRGVGRAPTLVDGRWPPSGAFFAQYFLYIPKQFSVKFQDFWSCAE